MLSSSQVQLIEEATKAGRVVKRYTQTVLSVQYLAGLSPILLMSDGLGISADSAKADEIIIGDRLSTLRPR